MKLIHRCSREQSYQR